MISYFERLLKEKTVGTYSELLYNQWMFDKRQVASSAQAILAFFPHYSLHDESHSQTILNSISRLLGDDVIERLSAIDLWLMLESAYYHDIGMILTAEAIEKATKTSDFIQYYKTINLDALHPLNKHSQFFELREGSLILRENNLSLEILDGFKFLIAGYFRGIHGQRTETIVKNPVGELGIDTPRSIIPQRIFRILGEICSSHTKEFSEVMKLPFSEVGISTEDAHPRFIASLLRIGDLLDIDNNRFSEVLLRTVSSVPMDSVIHKEKHLSISRYRLDNELIEITANCKDYNVSTLVQQWFDCLNNEYVSLMLRWHKIVPDFLKVSLPTLGKLIVNLEGFEFIDGKRKPSFSVDPIKALDILRGVGLYKEPFQCIREMLQNSLDSTLIKIWLDNPFVKSGSPINFKKEEIYRQYDIHMSINTVETSPESDKVTWRIAVTDKGIGLSKNDLKYIEKAGSSYRNSKRNMIIDDMPEWMKPSGIFGIGFQSIFSITNLVNISSKSFLTDEVLSLQLHSPCGRNTGDILIRKVEFDYKVRHGAVISFDMAVSRIPESMSISFDKSYATTYARTFDPIESSAINYEVSKIIDEVFRFNEHSYIPVHLSVNNEDVVFPSNCGSELNKYYDQETGIELFIKRNNTTETYFRGQYAGSNLQFKFLGFIVNILSGSAADVLTYNRNEIKSSYKTKLWINSLRAGFRAIRYLFDDFPGGEVTRLMGSMFIEYYKPFMNDTDFPFDHYRDIWENYEVAVNGQSTKLKDIMSYEEIKVTVTDQKKDQPYKFSIDGNSFEINISEPTIATQQPLFQFLFGVFSRYFSSIKLIDVAGEGIVEAFILNKLENVYPVSFEQLIRLMMEQKNMWNFGSRTLIPCVEKYKQLRIKGDSHASYIWKTPLIRHVNIDFEYPLMLSPFAYLAQVDTINDTAWELKLTDKLFNYVYANRYDVSVTKQDIISAYKSFVDESADSLMPHFHI